jgi:hypothetical protein
VRESATQDFDRDREDAKSNMFSGPVPRRGATGLDVLDKPLVRARLADATTISECTSRPALRLKLLLYWRVCFLYGRETYEQKSLRWYVVTFSIRFLGSSKIHLCRYCTGKFSIDLYTEDLRFIWFPGVHDIEFVRRIDVILQIWVRSIIRYFAILSPYSAVYFLWSGAFTVASGPEL